MGTDKSKKISVEERFLSKIAPDPNTGCWLWFGGDNGRGYGSIGVKGKSYLAHRFSYEHFFGKIPKGLQLDHLCRVRCCVNPAHLEPVTAKENCRRGLTGHHQRIKTHCPQGHPYTEDNIYKKYGYGRYCKVCRNEYARKYRERQKAKNND